MEAKQLFESEEAFNDYSKLSEHEKDKLIFENHPEYKDREFTIVEGSWIDLPEEYASPIFLFDNGDKVAFDRHGNLTKLK